MSEPISLMSPPFIATAAATIIAAAILGGVVRQVAFCAINVAFLTGVLLPLSSAASVGAFALGGYVLIRLAPGRGEWTFRLSLLALITAFVYANNYEFLSHLAPPTVLTSSFRAVGLSFLFFKIVHVLVDARSRTLGSFDLLTYANYCFNFSTFMMGPIQRYPDFRKQWHGDELAIPLTFEAHLDSTLRVLWGLARVYILAEWFRPLATVDAAAVVEMSFGVVLISVYAFYFFLYLNFAGYCDVAIGLGSLLGVRPPENFNRPFLATNISDFWQRQHRSLTLWLTDYVFTPAYKGLLGVKGFSERPQLSMALCLAATMLVSGLWHGASMNFLVFGALHGAYLTVYHVWDAGLKRLLGRKGAKRLRDRPIARVAGAVLTFHAAALAFVFFHFNVADASRVIARLGSL